MTIQEEIQQWLDYHPSYDDFKHIHQHILACDKRIFKDDTFLLNEFIKQSIEHLLPHTPYRLKKEKKKQDDDYLYEEEEDLTIYYFSKILYFLCEHDIQKKLTIWEPFSVSVLEAIPLLSDIIQPYIFSQLSKKPYRKACYELLINELTTYGFSNNDNFSDDISHEYRTQYFECFNTQLTKLNYTVNWKDILDKYPTLLVATLAHENSYKLTGENFYQLYLPLSKKSSHLKNSHLVQLYCDLLTQSDFFAHSLVPTKNINLAVAQFLKIPHAKNLINQPESSKLSDFIKGVVFYPEYQVHHYHYKLMKDNHIQSMGKELLTVDELKQFNQTQLSVSKPKI